MPAPAPRWRTFARRSLLAVTGGLAALGALELALRALVPDRTFDAADDMTWMRDGGAAVARAFTVDPEFGFRPIIPGAKYNEWGTMRNEYSLRKTADRTRLLFVGDSVTHRARIVDGLRALYGEEHYEWWNAGVESFAPVQYVRYYRRYNRAIHPDHVVVTFHLNDFATTPVAFIDGEGRLQVFSPKRPLTEINAWAFQHIRIYRAWLGFTGTLRTQDNQNAVRAEVRAALAELRDLVREDGGRLTIVLHPMMIPLRDWSPADRENHEVAERMFGELGLRYFTLTDALERGLAAGVEAAGPDHHHPSPEIARYFARSLHARGLLRSE